MFWEVILVTSDVQTGAVDVARALRGDDRGGPVDPVDRHVHRMESERGRAIASFLADDPTTAIDIIRTRVLPLTHDHRCDAADTVRSRLYLLLELMETEFPFGTAPGRRIDLGSFPSDP
jgi:hypothetical protein